jgi:zinc protease
MTAGMLTEGTRTRSAQEIARQIESLGATLQSGGGLDSSAVSVSAMPGKLPAALAIMADVARQPAFASEELERQRKQALDGLAVEFEEPGSLAAFAAAPVVFAGTPFGHVPGGTPGSLARLTVADLKAVHGAYYRPDNALLVLTGDIDAEQGFALAQAAFGDWRAPAGPAPVQPLIRPAAPPQAVVIDLPGAGQAAVSVVKSAIARNDPDYYSGVVANTVLGGGYSARLNQEIRIKRGLSYGASSSLSARRTAGSFSARAQTKNESAPQVLDLIREEMRRLGESGAGPDELKARKSVLIGGFGRELATADGLAAILGNLALYDVPLGEISLYTGRVEAVTGDQVQAFAKAHLDPAQASVIVAGDAKAFAEPLKARAPGLRVIPASGLDLDSPTLAARQP